MTSYGQWTIMEETYFRMRFFIANTMCSNMHTLCGYKDIINYRTDMFGNNLLHLAAHLGPLSDLNLRPGAALQMQREIQWFKVHSSSLAFSASSASVHEKLYFHLLSFFISLLLYVI